MVMIAKAIIALIFDHFILKSAINSVRLALQKFQISAKKKLFLIVANKIAIC